jgi:ubiquinone/menaquinone biosynthesis C-methylase UbiE
LKGKPNHQRAVQLYARAAGSYDDRLSLRIARNAQLLAVARLELVPGARVLDVACGTGVNFEAIEDMIGPVGRLVGVDLSRDMLERARERIRWHRWHNVTLLETAVEELVVEDPFDAALFSFAHDVLRSPGALERVLGRLRPGARVAAAGVVYPTGALAPLRIVVRLATRRYVTTFEGMGRPWSHLEAVVGTLRVERLTAGCLYVVSGRVGVPGL